MQYFQIFFFVLFCVLSLCNFSLGNSILLIIRSQNNKYHAQVANETHASINAQIDKYKLDCKVILLHNEWETESAWTILPLMPEIASKYSNDFDWFVFIEELTKVDLQSLVNVVSKYDFNKSLYFGRCLHDKSPTVIHHYAFFDGKVTEFKYPDFHAGWVMSKTLVKKIGSDWISNKLSNNFQIDIQHELAMYLDKQYNLKMICAKEFCGKPSKENCVTWVNYDIPNCGNRITLNDVLFSVKTAQMFHGTRVNVVKKTWGKYPKNIIYYSNVTDASVPSVDCGVPNTPKGHCGKMEAIIKFAHLQDDLKDFLWLVIADDDSIIGLSALLKMLNCYNPQDPLVLGERYGFGLMSGYGYSYITGGGSMVMSRGAIETWSAKGCKCPSIDSPDDMVLGNCFSHVGVPVTHSPRFHQARPNDYSSDYIDNLQPISFHKHWEIDPFKVYDTYFSKDDAANFYMPYEPAITEAPEVVAVPIPPTPTEIPIKDEL